MMNGECGKTMDRDYGSGLWIGTMDRDYGSGGKMFLLQLDLGNFAHWGGIGMPMNLAPFTKGGKCR